MYNMESALQSFSQQSKRKCNHVITPKYTQNKTRNTM